MYPIETAYNDHAAALRDLGASLRTAASVRYEAPPGMAAQGSHGGIPNPTLDVILDVRRSAVSEEMTRAAIALWHATETVKALTEKIDAAVARWQGEEAPVYTT